MTDSANPTVTDEILEDCLQAVQRSADQGRAPTAADVSAFAHIPVSTAKAALRELGTRGLLDLSAHGLALSDEGRRQAAAVIRRHRLSERLLTDVLGLPWDRVHDEAMRLEHSLTPEAESRLVSLLNDPATCPHGGPIPGSDGAELPPMRGLDTVPARLPDVTGIDVDDVPSGDVLKTIFHQVAGDLDRRVHGEKVCPGLIRRAHELSDGTVHHRSNSGWRHPPLVFLPQVDTSPYEWLNRED